MPLIPYTRVFRRPRIDLPGLDDQDRRVLVVVCQAQALTALDATARFEHERVAQLVKAQHLWLVPTDLGPLIIPGYLPRDMTQVPFRSFSVLANVAYQRQAITLAETQGWQVERAVGRHGVRITSASGVQSVLFSRVSGGPLPSRTVAALRRAWRSDLTVTGGTLYIVSPRPGLYGRMERTGPRMTIWTHVPEREWASGGPGGFLADTPRS